MTHHLSKPIHEQVHLAHARINGSHSSRQIEVKVPLADFSNPLHRQIVESRGLSNGDKLRGQHVALTISICAECGWFEGVSCHHGLSYWTHRPGCAKFDESSFDPPLPHSLVVSYTHAFPDDLHESPDPNCSGCLLLCPVCRADGT